MPAKKNYNLKTTAENYTNVRGKVVSKTLRALLPTRKELMDKKGNPREGITQKDLDDLFAAIDYSFNHPKPKESKKASKWRGAVGNLLDDIIAKEKDPHKRLRAMTAKIKYDASPMPKKKQIVNITRRSGVVKDQQYYIAVTEIARDKLDISKIDKETALTILVFYENGDMQSQGGFYEKAYYKIDEELLRRLREIAGASPWGIAVAAGTVEDPNKKPNNEKIEPTYDGYSDLINTIITRL